MPGGRPKQPVELVLLKGKKHLTKDEIKERRESEIEAPTDGIMPPEYLSKAQADEFTRIAAQLVGLKIFANLDCDALGMYLVARDEWVRLGKDYETIRKIANPAPSIWEEKGIDAMVKATNMRDKAFKQVMKCASELGLTITSRCKLVVPKQEKKPANKFARFGAG